MRQHIQEDIGCYSDAIFDSLDEDFVADHPDPHYDCNFFGYFEGELRDEIDRRLRSYVSRVDSEIKSHVHTIVIYK
ncbi:MAG TPA: hypothetical protein DCX27_19635 [Balneola sp.]|nr:hypothetical protein [Balneola sp.]